jgi:glycosyltransferase 2 family protein
VTPRQKRALALIWHAVVIALVGAAAWHFIDLPEVLETFASITWSWIALILVLATLDRFLMADKWLYLLRHVRSPAAFGDVLSAYYQAGFIQRCIPTSLSGDAMRAMVITGRHGRGSRVLATMVVERVIAMLSAAFIAVCGAIVILGDARQDPHELLLLSIPALLLVMLVGLRLTLYPPLVNGIIGALPGLRLRTELARIYKHYSGFRSAPGLLLGNFLYAVLEQCVQIALLLACALALGVEADPLTIVAAVSVAQCARKFALLLEGWVLGEFTSVVIYTALGIPGAQALAFSLLGQVSHMVASLPGALLFARSAINLRDIRGLMRPAPG